MDQSEPSATQFFLADTVAEDIEQSEYFLPAQTNDQSKLSATQFFLADTVAEDIEQSDGRIFPVDTNHRSKRAVCDGRIFPAREQRETSATDLFMADTELFDDKTLFAYGG